MTKVLLDYDPSTGMVKNDAGVSIGVNLGLEAYEDKPNKLEAIKELKAIGFDTDDIVKLNKEGMLE